MLYNCITCSLKLYRHFHMYLISYIWLIFPNHPQIDLGCQSVLGDISTIVSMALPKAPWKIRHWFRCLSAAASFVFSVEVTSSIWKAGKCLQEGQTAEVFEGRVGKGWCHCLGISDQLSPWKRSQPIGTGKVPKQDGKRRIRRGKCLGEITEKEIRYKEIFNIFINPTRVLEHW